MSTLNGNLVRIVSRPIYRSHMFREPRSLDWNVYVNNLMHFVFVHIIDLYVVFKWNVREF